MERGKCELTNCSGTHRDYCRIFKTRNGCNKTVNYLFLHRAQFPHTEAVDPETGDGMPNQQQNIKQLEESIKVLKTVLK